MTNKVLNLIFKATDKATPVINDIAGPKGTKGIGGIATSLKGLVGPATIAAGALTGVGLAIGTMMSDWQEHVLGVADFNAMIGGTIEETSVLIEISKDYDITMDTLLASMRMLASQGIEPNIEGLISVRDRLDDTTNAADRLKLAQELLGEQGIKQILPMLDQLTDEQLRNYIDTLTESEIVTEEMTESAREQKAALATLGDEWADLKMKVAGWAAPGLTALIQLLTTPFGPDSAAAFINKFFGLGSLDLNLNLTERQYTLPGYSGGGGGGGTSSGGGGGGGASGGGGGSSWAGRGGVQEGFQHGGRFTVGGFGGPDSTRVSFMGTPGESVTVGGGTSDMAAMLSEVRRLVNMLPLAISEAVERVM